jgi:hypothetical protein
MEISMWDDDFTWCEKCGNIVDQIRAGNGEKICQTCFDGSEENKIKTDAQKKKVAKYNKMYKKKNKVKINAQRRKHYAELKEREKYEKIIES